MEDSSVHSFDELRRNAKAGIVKRAITRYLFPKNHEASVKRHRIVGSPIYRKIIMGTVGRGASFSATNYGLNVKKGKMESTMDHAVSNSVFNETVHMTGVVAGLHLLAGEVMAGKFDITDPIGIPLVVNLGCVAVQRYNRARIMGVIDRSLQRGREFDENYTNWLGLDARALGNYYDGSREPVCLAASMPIIETVTKIPEVS